jgi:hypothetical protein
MFDIRQTLEELDGLENEFYGNEDNDFEDGVFEENYECAEWARSNVGGLFATIRRLATEVTRLKNKDKQGDKDEKN